MAILYNIYWIIFRAQANFTQILKYTNEKKKIWCRKLKWNYFKCNK